MSDNRGIPANRSSFFDPRTGLISREWYRFLDTIWTFSPEGELGTMAYQNADNVDITGGRISAITIDGVLDIDQGGTNSTTTPTAGSVAYGNGTAYRFTTQGTPGQFLTSQGAGAPTWTDQSADVTSISFGTTGLTPSTPTSGAVVVSGILNVVNGGTGVTTSTGATNVVLSDGPTLLTPIVTTTLGVGATTPAATGSGVTFPSTMDPSSDTHTLDDYEEGTFTPTVVGSVTPGSATYTVQTGAYTKIGNLVTFNLAIVLNSAHTGTGNALISGLPFVSSINATCSSYWDAFSAVVVGAPASRILSGQSQIDLSIYAAGAQSAITIADLTTTTTIWLSGSYAAT